MFAVRSLPRVALSRTPASLLVAPSQRPIISAIKGLLGVIPEPTAAEKKAAEEERVPLMQGPGAKLGTIPTDYEQATGIERYQMLGNMAGIDVFDQKPISVTRMGTMQDPIPVNCVIDERIIGCTGFPVDSHDPLWFKLHADEIGRCGECGNCFELTYHNPWAGVIPQVGEEAKGGKPLAMDAHHDHHH